MTPKQIRDVQDRIMELHEFLVAQEPCPEIDHTLQSLEEAVLTLNILLEQDYDTDISELLNRLK